MFFWIIVAWIVLGAKPSRKNLYILTGVVGLISLAGLIFASTNGEFAGDPAVVPVFVVGLVLWLALFMGMGFVIIWIRGGSVEGDAAKSKKLDKEMERIRAEIAARDSRPPAAQ